MKLDTDGASLHAVDLLPGDGDALPEGFGDAVRSLPERDQILLALYYWERLTLAEIGRVLGVSESRVSQLHSRATASLRTALAGRPLTSWCPMTLVRAARCAPLRRRSG